MRKVRRAALIIALGFVLLHAAPDGAARHVAEATLAPPVGPPPLWRDANGRPLPFSSHADAVEFLRTAEIVSMDDIGTGWTRPRRAVLRRGNIEARAIFRSLSLRQEAEVDPATGYARVAEFRDSATHEIAAYRLAALLELPFVPPTVRRIIDNREGTLQLWMEQAMSEQERVDGNVAPPHADWWGGVMGTLLIFDNLIYNADRNTGNLLIDSDWNVWFVDHTRAFQLERKLRNPENIRFCQRRLWERLNALTNDEITEALALYVDGRAIMALLARREKLIEHIEKLIEDNGEDAVLFDYSYDLADWRPAGNGP